METMMSTMTIKRDRVKEARERHHAALKAMLPPGSGMSGLEVWRKLRRLESKAAGLALIMCNRGVPDADRERIDAQVTAGVAKVFGKLPPGFFINHDPRGWALKLEPGSVPYPLHEDWGRYQILAPMID